MEGLCNNQVLIQFLVDNNSLEQIRNAQTFLIEIMHECQREHFNLTSEGQDVDPVAINDLMAQMQKSQDMFFIFSQAELQKIRQRQGSAKIQ
jgi:hypothetical protein